MPITHAHRLFVCISTPYWRSEASLVMHWALIAMQCPDSWVCCFWQVVWVDLRQVLLEEVYRHSVEQARLGPVLEQLDEALGTLCESTPKELHAGAPMPPLPCTCFRLVLPTAASCCCKVPSNRSIAKQHL